MFKFIPTLGPILSSVPAMGMSFLDSPEKALLVMALYVAIHALLFGFPGLMVAGLMVAVPLLATVMVHVQMLYMERADDARPAVVAHDPHLDEA